MSRPHVTVSADRFTFGLPASGVVDVVRPLPITPVPGADARIMGCLNLRGRIVTALDLRRCLSLPDRQGEGTAMYVVCESGQELYSLVVDDVGDVIEIGEDQVEPTPDNLARLWKDHVTSVFVEKQKLVALLDVETVIQSTAN